MTKGSHFEVVVDMGPAFRRKSFEGFYKTLSFENMLEQMEKRSEEAVGNVDFIQRVEALLAKIQ